MGKLKDLARAQYKEVKHIEVESMNIIIDALIPMPKGDLYKGIGIDDDGNEKEIIKGKNFLSEEELVTFSFFAKNYLLSYRTEGDVKGVFNEACTGFVTGNRIVNPVTVWADVKANITLRAYDKKDEKGDVVGQGVSISSLDVSFDNMECKLTTNTGGLRI